MKMQVLVYVTLSLFLCCQAQDVNYDIAGAVRADRLLEKAVNVQRGMTAFAANDLRREACANLYLVLNNGSNLGLALDRNCVNIQVPHAESVSGGYCLSSLSAAGYYRAGTVNTIAELLLGLSNSLGDAPTLTGSNSGGTMFIVRYFAFRDLRIDEKWTFPCYLLRSTYRHVCFFHGDFGAISEECYSENQNLVGAATGIVYGQLIMSNGGPLGIVSSYCSVYFSFLSNLPIKTEETALLEFWNTHSHWNLLFQKRSTWVAALTLVSSVEASAGAVSYNYGYDSYLSRGMNADYSGQWYSNMSVFSVASVSANTLSGISMMPFAFSGKQWDNSADVVGVSVALKLGGITISFVMLRKLISQHTVLVTTTAPNCGGACPLLDGGFTDNGPITPLLSAASDLDEINRPRLVSLLGPSNTMSSVEYLLGVGPLEIFTGAGVNLCPFTQVSICVMFTQARKLLKPQMSHEVATDYNGISSHYAVYRPNQQVMKPHCDDPLIFDHFTAMCKGDSICHMVVAVVWSEQTAVSFSLSNHLFTLAMIWLAPTNLATRFVSRHIPDEMRRMKYYADMDIWFPDFVAIAPQKGGVGFTKVAGHALLDYLTYLVMRLVKHQTAVRIKAYGVWWGLDAPCGYDSFEASQEFNRLDN